jgi:hypothetical protein
MHCHLENLSRQKLVGPSLVGENITDGVAGFGYSVNEAMGELVKQMDYYHRNWVEFADKE